MKLHIIVIRDSGADCYSQPQFVASIGAFVRGFGDSVKNKSPENQLSQHPADFEAFHIGTYDDADAGFEIFPVEKSICRGADYVVQS
ncbi:MAG: nonstructural protein [Microvirus sp.]|nr:MAG: nonstructural protein [Microvirus sp.]